MSLKFLGKPQHTHTHTHTKKSETIQIHVSSISTPNNIGLILGIVGVCYIMQKKRSATPHCGVFLLQMFHLLHCLSKNPDKKYHCDSLGKFGSCLFRDFPFPVRMESASADMRKVPSREVGGGRGEKILST